MANPKPPSISQSPTERAARSAFEAHPARQPREPGKPTSLPTAGADAIKEREQLADVARRMVEDPANAAKTRREADAIPERGPATRKGAA